MKKSVIIICAVLLILWLSVFCVAVIKAVSADIVGGADWLTLHFMLTECLRSPFGLAIQIISIAAAVLLVVLVIISLRKRSKRQ